jgi:hypothetical protein
MAKSANIEINVTFPTPFHYPELTQKRLISNSQEHQKVP